MASSREALTKGTPLLIPTYAQADYVQRMTLDGRVFSLHFTWNQREEAWYLSLADEEEVEIVSGIKIIANWALLDWYKYEERLPAGEFFAHDLTGDGSNPGYDDFGIGKRVELNYYSVSS